MSERNAGVGGGCQRGCNAGHDHERDAGFDERFGFFTAASKYKRIAALEPHNGFTLARQTDQNAFDVTLRAAEAAAFFPHEDAFGVGAGDSENFGRDQIIVNDHIRFSDEAVGLAREQLRVTGAGTDDSDKVSTRLLHISLSVIINVVTRLLMATGSI